MIQSIGSEVHETKLIPAVEETTVAESLKKLGFIEKEDGWKHPGLRIFAKVENEQLVL